MEGGELLATVRSRRLDQFQKLFPAFGLLILELGVKSREIDRRFVLETTLTVPALNQTFERRGIARLSNRYRW